MDDTGYTSACGWRRLALLWLLCVAGWTAAAQQTSIVGTVKDSATRQPIADVYVMLMSADGKQMLAYAFSDAAGNYAVDLPDPPAATYQLATSRMGYRALKQIVTSQIRRADLLLRESVTPLREVKITSQPIRKRGDTLNYYIVNFARPQDRTLADVLARMPGIEVRNDGRIQYDGKPINRFYIEDMNLLEHRYSLATKNLSPADIATVQVYENHEPVKMLRGRTDPEQAALNIKLKEGAKAKWLHTIEFGLGGWPLLYNASGTLARFARRNQTLLIGKVNNTGKEIFQELKIHMLKPGTVFRPGLPDGIADMLSPLAIGGSFFTRDRTRFNQSAIASVNQLWRIADDTDLRFNANYGFDRERRTRSISTEYRIPNRPSILIEDHTAQVAYWHKLENELAFTVNRSGYFLEEKLNVDIHRKEADAQITSPTHRWNQSMNLPRLRLRNNTSFSKLIGNAALSIGNKSEFTRLPQSLTVSSPDTLPLFSVRRVRQSVLFTDATSDTYAKLNFTRLHHTVELTTGAEWAWQSIESELDSRPTGIAQPFSNRQSWQSLHFYFEPSYRFVYRTLTLKAAASANRIQATYSGQRRSYGYINPRVGIDFEPSGAFKFNASYSRNLHYGDLNDLQTGYLMERYNRFVRGSEQIEKEASQSIGMDARYRNMLHFFTINAHVSHSVYSSNLVPATLIDDVYTFVWEQPGYNRSSFQFYSLLVSKLFPDQSLTWSLSLHHNSSRSAIEQQHETIPYRSRSYGFGSSVKWSGLKRLNLDYSLNGLLSGINTDKQPVTNYIPTFDHQMQAAWTFSERVHITSAIQHLYSRLPGSATSNLLFVDAGIYFTFKKLSLSVDWTNILNHRRHLSTFYNAINTITRTEHFRPSEILVGIRFNH